MFFFGRRRCVCFQNFFFSIFGDIFLPQHKYNFSQIYDMRRNFFLNECKSIWQNKFLVALICLHCYVESYGATRKNTHHIHTPIVGFSFASLFCVKCVQAATTHSTKSMWQEHLRKLPAIWIIDVYFKSFGNLVYTHVVAEAESEAAEEDNDDTLILVKAHWLFFLFRKSLHFQCQSRQFCENN